MRRSSSRTVLVIEDDEPKQKSVTQLLYDVLPEGMEIVSAASLSSAIRLLTERPIELAIVDMSLPTFDFATDRLGGGQPQGYGGFDILRFIETETDATRSLVLTQYEEFPSGNGQERQSIQGLEQQLKRELGTRFLGVIHYAGQQGDWRELLVAHLKNLGLVKND